MLSISKTITETRTCRKVRKACRGNADTRKTENHEPDPVLPVLSPTASLAVAREFSAIFHLFSPIIDRFPAAP